MNSSLDAQTHALRVTSATPLDLAEVHLLLESASTRLAERGFPNWLPAYPRDRLTADIDAGVVQVVRDALGTIVATYMLRREPVRPYIEMAWGDSPGNARYLNRFAVLPERTAQGIGSWVLRQLHRECTVAGVDAVRCDVLRANVPLRRFYERLGYERRGERAHSGWEFTVYERVLMRGE